MKRTKKAWGMLLLSIILTFSLAACSGKEEGGGSSNNNSSNNSSNSSSSTGTGSGGGDSGKKIELLFMTLGSNGYEKLVEDWNAANPNVQVTIQNTGDQTAHHNSLLTALSANSGAPDIFHMEIAFIDQFLQHEDKFHNLNDLGARDLKDLYLEWKWNQASSADGSFQIGLPTDVGPTAVFYRYDLIEAAGLPGDPEEFAKAIDTWEKFAEVAKQYKEKTGKAFTDTTDLVFNALRDQSDGMIYYDKQGNLIVENNPQVKKAYDFTVRGINEGWITKSPMWSNEWYSDMNNGEFAVTLSPAWMMSVIKGNAPDTEGKWRIAQMPVKAGMWGGAFVTLPKEGKHPKEAFEFITWLLNKEQQLRSFQENGLLTSIPELYTDPRFTDYRDPFFDNQQTGVAFGKAAERVQPMYYGPLHDTTDSYFKTALRNVIEGGADPEKEWQNALAEAKKMTQR